MNEVIPVDRAAYNAVWDVPLGACAFCAPEPAIIAHRSKEFNVMFDPAPVVEGHMTTFAREHFECVGDLPPDRVGELADVLGQVREALVATYGKATFYEHGRAGACMSDGPEHRLCHHMHLHGVPVAGDMACRWLLEWSIKHVELESIAEIPSAYETYGDYLFFQPFEGRPIFVPVGTEAIERHLLRTLVAREVGTPERANWRAHADFDLFSAGRSKVLSSGVGVARWTP